MGTVFGLPTMTKRDPRSFVLTTLSHMCKTAFQGLRPLDFKTHVGGKCQDSPTFTLKLEVEGLRDQGNLDGWNLYGVPHAMHWVKFLGLLDFASSTMLRQHDTSKPHNPCFIILFCVLLWTKACMNKTVMK